MIRTRSIYIAIHMWYWCESFFAGCEGNIKLIRKRNDTIKPWSISFTACTKPGVKQQYIIPGLEYFALMVDTIRLHKLCNHLSMYGIREVSLNVKHERVRVTSHSGAQFRYKSCSCALLGFASRCNVSFDKQGHRYQQMPRQQHL